MKRFARDYFKDNWHRFLWVFCALFAAKGLHLVYLEDWGGWAGVFMGVVAPVAHFWITYRRAA
ncbi:hypothetical protein [Pontibacter mangrovi]|uniref:2TM domain-containing protein n=1 Tax=Pontibacter mangrovi TaxID=2589816 RepID=A0A501W6M0_9BACT|nr:hypothetical protein [Pontibacter mangrovi]TPE44938.1 hypothetical protein FJM65_07950 [Pontibacter mangrovi]